ncbi:MAG TPA: hypothetical protein VMI31_10730, partial [Fimbriimonadaceae bacterium]|nr:hypothetical protein [Fimbriimonadaceae bacterium]
MNHTRQKTMTVKCQITGQNLPLDDAIPVDLIRDPVVATLKETCPNLDVSGYVSKKELDKARIRYAQEMSQHEMDDLVQLKKEVAESLLRQETITKNIDMEFD